MPRTAPKMKLKYEKMNSADIIPDDTKNTKQCKSKKRWRKVKKYVKEFFLAEYKTPFQIGYMDPTLQAAATSAAGGCGFGGWIC